jgi:hypothetical protein
MRTLALVLVAAACGGGSKPTKTPDPDPPPPAPSAPAPGTTVEANVDRPADAMPRTGAVAESQPAPPPEPAPTPPPSALAILDRMHDKAGEIPGMPGWSLKRVEDKTVCSATRIAITRGKRKLDADQLALAKVYGLTFPADLSFDPANKQGTEASLKRFSEFVEKMKKTGADATKHFEASLAGELPAKTAAAARIGQVSLQMASLLARAPIPKDVRSGDMAAEKIDAYCDKMEEVAGPLAIRGQEALAVCAKAGAPAGWYSALCATAPE